MIYQTNKRRLLELLYDWQGMVDPTDPIWAIRKHPNFAEAVHLIRKYRKIGLRYLVGLLEQSSSCGILIMVLLEELTGQTDIGGSKDDVPFWRTCWIEWARDNNIIPILEDE